MLKKRTKRTIKVVPVRFVLYTKFSITYEEQTEILVVQHDLFRQTLSAFILMYYFMCVHIQVHLNN